jgi:hypothetical protein
MSSTSQSSHSTPAQGRSPVFWVIAVLAWLWVAVPFTYGLVQLVSRIPALFSG